MKSESESSTKKDFVLIPKGGRPKKYSRNAAVFIAHTWRTKYLNESVKVADQWVIDRFPGLTEPAHVRSVRRKIQDTYLNDCIFTFNEGLIISESDISLALSHGRRLSIDWHTFDKLPVNFNIEKCAISVHERTTSSRIRACIWAEGMREVRIAKLIPHDELVKSMKNQKS